MLRQEGIHVVKNMFMPLVLSLALSVPALAANGAPGPLGAGNQGGNSQGGNSQGGNSQGGNSQGGNSQGGVRGAPGPLVGAGLPVLLIGGGIYWLVRRKKGQARTP
jgi:uncharacterized membrane protein